MDDKLKAYAIGTLTLALLISLGFNVSPDDNFICRDQSITKYCNRLSSTYKTCYPLPDIKVGSKFCEEGWEQILINQPPTNPILPADYNIGTIWECSADGCERIK